MLITCAGSNWTAEVIASNEISPDGLLHFYCTSEGESQQAALGAVKAVLMVFGGGRETFVRNAPEAVSERNFDTQEQQHRGFTRFSVVATPDKQTLMPNSIAPIPFGELQTKEAAHG